MNTTWAIVTGVISAIVFELTVILGRKTIIPWIQSVIYHEADLSGQWYAKVTNPSGNVQDMTMTLRHHGRRLDGKLSVAKHIQTTGVTEIKEFSVGGDIQHRFVIVNARNLDTHAIGVATFLLEVIGDARTMTGLGNWYSITSKRIEHTRYEWNKGKAQS